MLRYTLYRLQLAKAVGECILQRWGSDALFQNHFGEDLLILITDTKSTESELQYDVICMGLGA